MVVLEQSKVRRPLAQAQADAEAFRDLFPPACYRRWEIAGSVRRRSAECGDVDHVIIPAFGEVDVGHGLFTTKQEANLLWHRLDALVGGGHVSKHFYGASGYRWGDRQRGADFRGHNHELLCVEPDTWGAALAIKTGPAEFSRRLVTGLLRNRRRNHLGRVWHCEPCTCSEGCGRCHETGLVPIMEISVPDERRYFALAGVKWAEPRERQ